MGGSRASGGERRVELGGGTEGLARSREKILMSTAAYGILNGSLSPRG